MNPDLDRLQDYPFERLARLKRGLEPPRDREPITLSIGEPQHSPPGFVVEALITHLHQLSSYPATLGTPALREAGVAWLARRFALPAGALDPGSNLLPVAGTREALFAIAQVIVDRTRPTATVVMPNPFYQIYEGATLLAGARAYYVNATRESGYLPDLESVPADIWADTQLLYLCNPHNPTGAVMSSDALRQAILLADRFDFVIAADECYSEIYDDESSPPPGLLQVAADMGRQDFSRCLVFHSLSKRSNLPGLRSGLVAGDAALIARFHRYRTYHGCAMPLPTQAASAVAWSDEAHVQANRQVYREKFEAVAPMLAGALGFEPPPAGFYLWARTPGTDTDFARELYAREAVTVLPGSFLSREAAGANPGVGHVRIALVPPIDECVDAAMRIRRVAQALRH
jgi:N-succinyldiaminopimelate aminotransferase